MRKLTQKQLEVMKVLWDHNKPMISSEIEKSNPSEGIMGSQQTHDLF